MKATVEIPDSVFRQAEALAAARGVTVERLLAGALEERLRGRAVGERAEVASSPWMEGFGALSHLADENRRILDMIEENTVG